ncbi:unnamed protein product [Closterium sp. Naga37s-1]|nr:unnamed protein product [Closterium sp. Naga37s-1]
MAVWFWWITAFFGHCIALHSLMPASHIILSSSVSPLCPTSYAFASGGPVMAVWFWWITAFFTLSCPPTHLLQHPLFLPLPFYPTTSYAFASGGPVMAVCPFPPAPTSPSPIQASSPSLPFSLSPRRLPLSFLHFSLLVNKCLENSHIALPCPSPSASLPLPAPPCSSMLPNVYSSLRLSLPGMTGWLESLGVSIGLGGVVLGGRRGAGREETSKFGPSVAFLLCPRAFTRCRAGWNFSGRLLAWEDTTRTLTCQHVLPFSSALLPLPVAGLAGVSRGVYWLGRRGAGRGLQWINPLPCVALCCLSPLLVSLTPGHHTHANMPACAAVLLCTLAFTRCRAGWSFSGRLLGSGGVALGGVALGGVALGGVALGGVALGGDRSDQPIAMCGAVLPFSSSPCSPLPPGLAGISRGVHRLGRRGAGRGGANGGGYTHARASATRLLRVHRASVCAHQPVSFSPCGANGGGYMMSEPVQFACCVFIVLVIAACCVFIVLVCALVNLLPIRNGVGRVLLVGVIIQVLAGVITIITLPLVAPTLQPAWWVFGHLDFSTANTNMPSNGYAVLVGLLMSQYALYSFDTGAHASEEAKRSDVTTPIAMVGALTLVSFLEWAVVVVLTFCIQDEATLLDEQNAAGGKPVIQILWTIFNGRYGSTAGVYVFICLFFSSFFFCTITLVFAACRVGYALARDKGLPFSFLWRRINKRKGYALARDKGLPFSFLWRRINKRKVPVNALMCTVGIAIVALLPLLGGSAAYFAVTGMATVGWFGAYGVPILFRILQDDGDFVPGPFYLRNYFGKIGR